MVNKILGVVLLSLFLYSCEQNTQLDRLDFLLGTWKMEGKENYEFWTKENNDFIGEGYKIVNNSKVVSEKLTIKSDANDIIYVATVLNQNQGKGISFSLNKVNDSLFSFENLKHDFPKKIQYKIISNNKILVSVLGSNDKGFSYYLNKK